MNKLYTLPTPDFDWDIYTETGEIVFYVPQESIQKTIVKTKEAVNIAEIDPEIDELDI